MIKKYMRGRLGNQMFQYAMIRAIQEKNGNLDKIYLNFDKYVYAKGFTNDLKHFKTKRYTEVEDIRLSKFQIITIYFLKVIKRIIRFFDKKNYYIKRHKLEDKLKSILQKIGIYWMEDGYLEIDESDAKNKIVIGHFESGKNFNQIKDKLFEEFEPKEKPLEKNKELYDLIYKTNSVCVTIRRGDFTSNNFSKQFNVCDIDYFNKAVSIMNEKLDNPTFFIFSDDIAWCKKNIKIKGSVYFEDGNDPVWEKLRLMYSCKHFIISNSTFSYWAQYLSRNDEKIVIAPKKWLNYGYYEDIYEDDWIKI